MWNETNLWEEWDFGKSAQATIDFVVRTAEMMLLAGAFQVAANATDNRTIDGVSSVMYLVLTMHFALAWARYIAFPLYERKARTKLSLTFLVATSIAGLFLLYFLTVQIRDAAKALVPTEIETVDVGI
jgi:hypothetical protein